MSLQYAPGGARLYLALSPINNVFCQPSVASTRAAWDGEVLRCGRQCDNGVVEVKRKARLVDMGGRGFYASAASRLAAWATSLVAGAAKPQDGLA
jgi:hypothetical protein